MTTSDLSSSLDVTNISDPNAEVFDKTSTGDQSAVGGEGVFTSTPLAAAVLRSSSVPNVVQPVAFLEVSDDSEASKRSCKLWIIITTAFKIQRSYHS